VCRSFDVVSMMSPGISSATIRRVRLYYWFPIEKHAGGIHAIGYSNGSIRADLWTAA